jgi:tyrosyl-tRNA synthetase
MKTILSEYRSILKKNAVDCIGEDQLDKKLRESIASGKPLTLKIGFDPTSADIHLGHTVLLRKLRRLQDFGHSKVCLIIGDFTAKIGDPSGRTALRPVLSEAEIKNNADTYCEQAFKILDRKKTKQVYNSRWYKDMVLSDFLPLLSSYTIARILERDDFSKRLKAQKPLTMLELVYPLIQGYDSVMSGADIEFGGTDQKFNLLVGRYLQEVSGQLPQAVVTMPILVGLDGKEKMSKSLKNYIGVTEEAKVMFGKIMSISDEAMWEYFRLLTDKDIGKVKSLHPREAKKQLAQEIAAHYHGPAAAQKEAEEFDRVFSRKEVPQNTAVYEVKQQQPDLIELLAAAGMVSSRNEARRLKEQGALYYLDPGTGEQIPVKSDSLTIGPDGVILKIGKKKFLKITYKTT